jgi:hypothetical protein
MTGEEAVISKGNNTEWTQYKQFIQKSSLGDILISCDKAFGLGYHVRSHKAQRGRVWYMCVRSGRQQQSADDQDQRSASGRQHISLAFSQTIVFVLFPSAAKNTRR